jgi:hypothetical protein
VPDTETLPTPTNGAVPAFDVSDITERAAEFTVPKIRGPYATLRSVGPEDYQALRGLETSSDMSTRWRLRGQTPSPEQWAQSLWNGVLAQFIVMETKTSKPMGLVAVYRPNFQEGHAYLAAGRFDLNEQTPVMIFGVAMFLEYVFSCWDFRKLYMELPEFNYPQFQSGLGKFFEVEGRLRDHTFGSGRYWDELTLALYRDRWREQGSRLIGGSTTSLFRDVAATNGDGPA